MNWCRGCRKQIVHPVGYCHVEGEVILPCECGQTKTISGTGRAHAHVCLQCRRACWACGHPLSGVDGGGLFGRICGRCQGERLRKGHVVYRRLPPPCPDGPTCIKCGTLLNPKATTRTCLFCAEELPDYLMRPPDALQHRRTLRAAEQTLRKGDTGDDEPDTASTGSDSRIR